MLDAQLDQSLTDVCLNCHSVCNEKIAIVRILRTQQFVTYWCGFLRRTIDKILFKHKIRIWLKSAVWYATALNQLEGIKSRPSTGIILAFIEAQIWSTGYCTYSWIKKLCQ